MSVGVFSNKDTFATAFQAAFNCPDEEVEAALLNLYVKEATITINLKQMTFDELVLYINAVRDQCKSVDIKSHRLLRDGNLFSERHTAYRHGKDGTEAQSHGMLQFELNESGKAIWLEGISL